MNYALIGKKLGHSYSKILHEEIYNTLGLKDRYSLIELEEDFNLRDVFNEYDLDGVNVTIPYKQTVMKFLDKISAEAEKIGSVNTVLKKDGLLYGYNTDYFGFKYILTSNDVKVDGKRAVILGSGGASKAVYQVLLDMKAKDILLVSRRKDNKNDVIDYEDLKSVKGDIIINTTPVGMFPVVDNSPVSESVIKNFDTVVDIIYNPYNTKFLSIANDLGKKVCFGLDMLVMQGIKSFEIWKGMEYKKKEYIIDFMRGKVNG